MGPIGNYANHRCITGRAGLRPCRYQSDQVDRANGPLVHNCNRKLRAAILGIADNLILCNHHFNVLGHHWKLTAFHREHQTTGPDLLRDLQAAVAQLPRKEHQAEAGPLHEELEKIQAGRRGPQLLGNILPIVLARLGVGAVQSTSSGEQHPH